ASSSFPSPWRPSCPHRTPRSTSPPPEPRSLQLEASASVLLLSLEPPPSSNPDRASRARAGAANPRRAERLAPRAEAAPAGPERWRRERDSNPRGGISAYTISNRAPSTARTSLRNELRDRARQRGSRSSLPGRPASRQATALRRRGFAAALPARAKLQNGMFMKFR